MPKVKRDKANSANATSPSHPYQSGHPQESARARTPEQSPALDPQKMLVALCIPGEKELLYVVALGSGECADKAIKTAVQRLVGAGFNDADHAVESMVRVLGTLSLNGVVHSSEGGSVVDIAGKNDCSTYVVATVSPKAGGAAPKHNGVLFSGVTNRLREAVFSKLVDYGDLGVPVPDGLSSDLTAAMARARTRGDLDAALSQATPEEFCDELGIEPADLTDVDEDFVGVLVALNERTA